MTLMSSNDIIFTMEEKKIVKVSVRNLVEFILRQGDIDNRTTAGMDKDAMQQGSRIHRKIQRRMGSNYHAEVPLKTIVSYPDMDIQVEGRADGIIHETEGIKIDEIKGVLKELTFITKASELHLAQGKCYAYIHAKDKGLDNIKVQLTYCQMETEEIKRFEESYHFPQLEEWFLNLVKQYEKWARFAYEWRIKRNESIRTIDFPFPYREGQKNLVVSVYKTILRKKKLFIQAPTGVGKTLATVFPAVKAVGEELGEKIFYLTAKTITRTVAQQAFDLLKNQGLEWKSLSLTAKEKICFNEETNCNPDHCIYAKGHYDRINDAIFDLINQTNEMKREDIEKQAKKHQVCPFEMTLDTSLWVDSIICDYNYAFDPNAHLKRFFGTGNNGGYLFLIDEAHNLVERGREMYSASLYKEEIMAIRRLVKTASPKLAKRLEECNKQLLILKKECESWKIQPSISHIALKLMNVLTEMELLFEKQSKESSSQANLDEEKKKKVLELYFQVRHFLNIHEALDENYTIYTEFENDGRFKLKLYCVNPATNLREYLKQGNSTVFFSATLLPIHYYKKLLSVEQEDYAIYAESTFPKENRSLLIGTDVSTKYTKRSPEMYQKIAQYIFQVAKGKAGNYITFFPSYKMMQEVFEHFEEMLSREGLDINWVIQNQYMSEESREIFLENFEEERENSLVGFCVMGGIFSEGIDLTQERLIGAIIVGTGLPQVGNEREILKQHFDQLKMPGFDYAYLYPGMNKVLQSAGRVIRTDKDKGMILLLDERFLQRQYLEIFPREWQDFKTCRQEKLQLHLTEFWDN